MEYKIEIKETLSRIINVEAENESEAIAKARLKYKSEEIVLDNRDYIDTEINIYEE